MRLKSLIRIVLLLLCFSGGVSAQSPADSAALANASWRTVYDADGMTVRKLSIRLFDSDQQISCIEIAPEKYRLAVIQDSLRTKTSRIGKQSGAVAAINGGFFKTRTKQAVAMGFIKTGGYRPAQIGAETGVAVAVDTAGVLRLIDWSLAMEQADAPHRDWYPDVMVTGPMLLRGGRSLIPSAILRRDESRRNRPADGRGRTAEPRGGDGPVRIGLCGPPDGSGGCDKPRRGRIFDLVDEGAGDRQRSFRPDALFSLGTSRLQCDRRET